MTGRYPLLDCARAKGKTTRDVCVFGLWGYEEEKMAAAGLCWCKYMMRKEHDGKGICLLYIMFRKGEWLMMGFALGQQYMIWTL